MNLLIEKSAFGGSSLAFSDSKAVFIPFTIPGETVSIGKLIDKKDYCTARYSAVVQISPDRVAPECPNFMICGGCDYLHMTYERELAEKKSIILDSVSRIAKMKDGIPGIETLSGGRFYYRSHALIKNISGVKGFFAKDSHELAAFPREGCRLLMPELNEVIKTLSGDSAEFKIALDKNGRVYSSGSGLNQIIEEESNGILYKRKISSFFQGNAHLRSLMAKMVTDFTGNGGNTSVLELGCGSGFFSLQLAKVCGIIKGIEIDSEAVKSAVKNAELNGITNAVFACRSDESIDPVKDAADIVVADPPRRGLSKKTRSAIIEMNPGKIIYISCNPSTWARDLQEFAAGGYHLKRLVFADMFPGTQHIEIISLFEKTD